MSGAALASRLVDAGLSAAEHEAKTALFAQALAALGERASEASAWWVPGRIEFLGKHTDYAGGRSLLCATERGVAVVAVPRDDAMVVMRDALSGEPVHGMLRADLDVPANGWGIYPLTVCRRVARNFPGATLGADIAFASDLPPAAGLSSSSALVVATWLVLADVNELSLRIEYRRAIGSPEDLAGYLGAVESGRGFAELAGDRGVGTLGGSQDHTAILCARAGALAQYSFAPVRFERSVPLPADHVFVVACSGVPAAKTGNALAQYNRAAARVAAAVRSWQAHAGETSATLRDVLESASLDKLDAALRAHNDSDFPFASLHDRVEQFRDESMVIIPSAGDALARGDLTTLGDLVAASQASAERRLDNQVPETIALARTARELGAVAASAFGAGFGGSVYALVSKRDAGALRREWAARYASAFPHRATDAMFLVTRAGPPASRL